jgi:hypothetical protein
VNSAAALRRRLKAARKRGARWAHIVDILRLLRTAEGRSILWTSSVHRSVVHQTTSTTSEDRYPDLFDCVARLRPDAERILSFGCSTGEELASLRSRFPSAEIVGAEINPRSRRVAKQRMAFDGRMAVIPPTAIHGDFDIVLALAVLQREPLSVFEAGWINLSSRYSYAHFDNIVRQLVAGLRTGGLLCVIHSHYRIEDSSVISSLQPIDSCPRARHTYFGPDGLRLPDATSATVFRKIQ